MALIKMRMKNSSSNTPLSNAFIDRYLPDATPMYVMVYIIGLRHCLQDGEGISIKDLSQTLRMLESEVVSAWRYWESKNLIKIIDDNVENFSIEFYSMDDIENINNQNSINQNSINQNTNEIKIDEPKPKDNIYRLNLATQPSYTPKEIDIYMERSEEIRRLFKSAETILAKPLTQADLNMILTFFEWYALPIDVIEVMLEYCVANNKRGKNYMETVARDWSENGIDTVDAANAYINTYTVYYNILKAFGITGKTPNKKQIDFMKIWINQLKLPMEIIIEACETTFLQTGKAEFTYANRILDDWANKNIKTIDDVNKATEQFKEEKKSRESSKPQQIHITKQPYKNRFINYEQREWDFDTIEKLAQDKL